MFDPNAPERPTPLQVHGKPRRCIYALANPRAALDLSRLVVVGAVHAAPPALPMCSLWITVGAMLPVDKSRIKDMWKSARARRFGNETEPRLYPSRPRSVMRFSRRDPHGRVGTPALDRVTPPRRKRTCSFQFFDGVRRRLFGSGRTHC
jgi:hypothetical protein